MCQFCVAPVVLGLWEGQYFLGSPWLSCPDICCCFRLQMRYSPCVTAPDSFSNISTGPWILHPLPPNFTPKDNPLSHLCIWGNHQWCVRGVQRMTSFVCDAGHQMALLLKRRTHKALVPSPGWGFAAKNIQIHRQVCTGTPALGQDSAGMVRFRTLQVTGLV